MVKPCRAQSARDQLQDSVTIPTPEKQLEIVASSIKDKFYRYQDMSDEEAIRNFLINNPNFLDVIPSEVGKQVFPKIFYTPGEYVYHELGLKGATFGERVGFQFKNIVLSVYGAVPGLIGFDSPRIEAEKRMKKIAESPDIQAYMAWREDEPVTAPYTDTAIFLS